MTISTSGSADTIPLGTDLDLHNGYCNLWAAGKVHDPNARRLGAGVKLLRAGFVREPARLQMTMLNLFSCLTYGSPKIILTQMALS